MWQTGSGPVKPAWNPHQNSGAGAEPRASPWKRDTTEIGATQTLRRSSDQELQTSSRSSCCKPEACCGSAGSGSAEQEARYETPSSPHDWALRCCYATLAQRERPLDDDWSVAPQVTWHQTWLQQEVDDLLPLGGSSTDRDWEMEPFKLQTAATGWTDACRASPCTDPHLTHTSHVLILLHVPAAKLVHFTSLTPKQGKKNWLGVIATAPRPVTMTTNFLLRELNRSDMKNVYSSCSRTDSGMPARLPHFTRCQSKVTP